MKVTSILQFTSVLSLSALLGACGSETNNDTALDLNVSEPPAATSIYEAAVANPARPEADRTRDAGRKPGEVLEFLGIEQGMTVLDMFTGGGYYAELLSVVVGPEGRVIAQSNEAYLQFVGDAFAARFGDGRLKNVDVLMAENNQLELQPDSLDAVMLVLSFHDLYLSDQDNGWEKIEIDSFLGEISKGLKSGGIVGIIDHYAESGAPAETGNTVHRIDPAIVVDVMTNAGFELDGQSELLRNPSDDLSKIVFAPEIRGNTDRFVMRFKNAK